MGKKKRKVGYPTKYSNKVAKRICAELMKGRTLTNICKEEKMPSLVTVYKWLNAANKTSFKEDFYKSYVLAREVQAEVFADQIIDISDDRISDDKIKVSRAKLRTDVRKWIAAHLLPRKFSDKMQLTGANGDPLIPPKTKININFVPSKNKRSK